MLQAEYMLASYPVIKIPTCSKKKLKSYINYAGLLKEIGKQYKTTEHRKMFGFYLI